MFLRFLLLFFTSKNLFKMHILIVSHNYPNLFNPHEGIFFRDQVLALSQNVENKVGVLAVVPVSIKVKIKNWRVKFGTYHFKDANKIETYIRVYLNIPKINNYIQNKSLTFGMPIFEEYIAKNGMPDIIHLHRYESGLLVQEIKKKYAVPYVVTEHSSQFLLGKVSTKQNQFVSSTFKNAERNFAVSKRLADILFKQYGISFDVIPNIVDTDFFTLKPDRNDKKSFTILSVGFLTSNKNHQLLIKAFSLFNKSVANSRLKIIGNGIEYSNLTNLIKSLNLSHNVELLGLKNREEVKRELHLCDLFALTSVVETFGVVVIEALSTGTPVVSTLSGGPNEIIEDISLGKLCANSVEELYEIIHLSYNHFGNFDKNVIRSKIVSKYSNQAIGTRLQNEYEKVIEGKKSGMYLDN